jgi:GNAT superfamily N-acetyltransferase
MIRRQTTKQGNAKAMDLERACFAGDAPYTNPKAVWFLAFEGRTPIGFASVTPVHGEPGVWFLSRAGVLKGWRGRGLQKRLIRVREKYVRSRGGHTMLTYVHPQNMASANNLIAEGYRLYDPQWKWGLKSALYFYKKLE